MEDLPLTGRNFFNGVLIPNVMTFDDRKALILKFMNDFELSESDLLWLLEMTNRITIVECPKEARRVELLQDEMAGAF